MNCSVAVKYVLAVGFSMFLFSCGQDSGYAVKNVFNEDNREYVLSTDLPWSAIGRLETGCTATLVGKRLILTAAHCLFEGPNGKINSRLGEFKPNLINNQSPDTYWVDYMWFGTDNPDADRGKDWAVLRLNKSVDSRFGSLSVAVESISASLPYTTNLVGYSNDRSNGETASVHRGCYIHEVAGVRMLHDCDGATGVSGGPLLNSLGGSAKIVGITVSEFRGNSPNSLHVDSYRRDAANVAISAEGFASVIGLLLTSVDQGGEPVAILGAMNRANPNRPGVVDPVDPNRPVDPGNLIFNSPPSWSKLQSNALQIGDLARTIYRQTREVQNEVRLHANSDGRLVGLSADIATSVLGIGTRAEYISGGRGSLEYDPANIHGYFVDLWQEKIRFLTRVRELRSLGVYFDEDLMVRHAGLIDRLTRLVYL